MLHSITFKALLDSSEILGYISDGHRMICTVTCLLDLNTESPERSSISIQSCF